MLKSKVHTVDGDYGTLHDCSGSVCTIKTSSGKIKCHMKNVRPDKCEIFILQQLHIFQELMDFATEFKFEMCELIKVLESADTPTGS